MAQETWTRVTFGGKEYWQVESLALVEVDPQGQTLFFVGTPRAASACSAHWLRVMLARTASSRKPSTSRRWPTTTRPRRR